MPPPLPDPDHSLERRRREFGLRVRELRRRQRWTQETLAHLAGLDRKTVNRLEQGRHSPAIDRVFLLADAFGVEPGELFVRPERRDHAPGHHSGQARPSSTVDVVTAPRASVTARLIAAANSDS